MGGDMFYYPSIIFGVSESTKLVKDETPTASLGSNHFYYCSSVLASRWIILHFITFYWRLMLVVAGGGWQQQHGNETSNNYIFQMRILGLKGEKLRGRNGIFYSIVSTFNILRECLNGLIVSIFTCLFCRPSHLSSLWWRPCSDWVLFLSVQSSRFRWQSSLPWWRPDSWLILSTVKLNLPSPQQPVRTNRRNLFWRMTQSVGSLLEEQTASWTARE